MQDTVNTENMLAKVSLLSSSGIDIHGFHTIEYQIELKGGSGTTALLTDIEQVAPGTYILVKPFPNKNACVVRLRVNSFLFEKNLAITTYWVSDLTAKHEASIKNWRVVIRV